MVISMMNQYKKKLWNKLLDDLETMEGLSLAYKNSSLFVRRVEAVEKAESILKPLFSDEDDKKFEVALRKYRTTLFVLDAEAREKFKLPYKI